MSAKPVDKNNKGENEITPEMIEVACAEWDKWDDQYCYFRDGGSMPHPYGLEARDLILRLFRLRDSLNAKTSSVK